MISRKDKGILSAMTEHCDAIAAARSRFGDSLDAFAGDRDYFNSVCMALLQIGELANHFTPEFRESHTDIPLRQIRGLRNIVAHGYGIIDVESVWNTVCDDIPKLLMQCERIFRETE